MAHSLIKATIIPSIVQMVAQELGITDSEAFSLYYKSAIAYSLDDDSTGLYGQSALYIFSLFMQEQEAQG